MASYAHLQGQVDAFFTKSAGQTDSAALRSEASGLVEAAVSAAGQEILKGQRGDEHGFSAAKLFFELALRLDATNQAARAGVEKAHAALNAVAVPKPASGAINEKTEERTSSDARARWLRRAALRVKGISFAAILWRRSRATARQS